MLLRRIRSREGGRVRRLAVQCAELSRREKKKSSWRYDPHTPFAPSLVCSAEHSATSARRACAWHAHVPQVATAGTRSFVFFTELMSELTEPCAAQHRRPPPTPDLPCDDHTTLRTSVCHRTTRGRARAGAYATSDVLPACLSLFAGYPPPPSPATGTPQCSCRIGKHRQVEQGPGPGPPSGTHE